mmetsp:Transcript_30555/g.60483  ORF Transcript_30555/g.60483 Transcript_30555/m.60483 type:complete len:112 (-) Transcript_30555:187-522(-)
MDDQKEIKNLYRAQLDELVELQATQTPVKTREDGGLGLEENSEIGSTSRPAGTSSDGVRRDRPKGRGATGKGTKNNAGVTTPAPMKKQQNEQGASSEMGSPVYAGGFDLVY